MRVELMYNTPLSVSVIAARTCWSSFNKGGNYEIQTDKITEEDKNLLIRLLFKNKHESIFEHISYNFNIFDMPRFVLQELARHRIASYSVKSTRYTLKELKNEDFFINAMCKVTEDAKERAKKYIDLCEDDSQILYSQMLQLEQLRNYVSLGKSLDTCKYLVPENYKCDLVMTMNVRSLRNFLELRLSKAAHFKIRELAQLIYECIPEDHKFLFGDLINN